MDNFPLYPIDILYARVDTTVMKNTELPAEWTDKQRAAYAALKASIEQPRTISFGKAPKDGWKESDRVAK